MSAAAAESPSDQPTVGVGDVAGAGARRADTPGSETDTSSTRIRRSAAPQFDQAAIERIIRRAQDMAPPTGDQQPGLTEDDLVAIGREVGLSADLIRRASAIERVGPPAPRRRLDRVVGSATVTTVVDVRGGSGVALQRTDALLVGGHHLRRDRLDTDKGEWVRRRDAIGAAQRSLRRIAGEGELSTVAVVRARVAEVGDSTVVRLEADRHGERLAYGAGGSAVGLVLASGAAVVGVVLTPLALAGLPAAVAAGVGVASLGRRRERDLQRCVERVGTQIQAGVEPRPISADLRDRLRRKQ